MTSTSHRYSTNDPDFDATHGVLKNILGLTDEQALEQAENQALIEAYDEAAIAYSENDVFTSSDVCHLHKKFLGKIYKWAGSYRTIDLSSPGIRWCHAKFIEKEMQKFGARLEELTPFSPDLTREEIIARLAEIHGELVVIHPFRDGNGRTTRLLCDLLLMQAELPPISPTVFDDKKTREEYFAAIRDVWTKVDYSGLIQLFEQLVAVKS